MTNAKAFGYLRLFTAAAIIFAVAWQIIDRLVHNVFRPGEYFAFFTILTSLFTAAVLIGAGLALMRSGEDSPGWMKLRVSLTTAYVIVAVVYNILLRNDNTVAPADALAHYQWPTPPNEIVHVWAPALVLADFVLARFGERLKLRAAWSVLIYPLAWLVATIIRGIATGWWPYWFLDPTGAGGVGGMLTYAGLITVFFTLVGFGLTALQRALAGRRATSQTEALAE